MTLTGFLPRAAVIKFPVYFFKLIIILVSHIELFKKRKRKKSARCKGGGPVRFKIISHNNTLNNWKTFFSERLRNKKKKKKWHILCWVSIFFFWFFTFYAYWFLFLLGRVQFSYSDRQLLGWFTIAHFCLIVTLRIIFFYTSWGFHNSVMKPEENVEQTVRLTQRRILLFSIFLKYSRRNFVMYNFDIFSLPFRRLFKLILSAWKIRAVFVFDVMEKS